MFVILFTFPTASLAGHTQNSRYSRMDDACIPKKTEQPIIQTAEKTRHEGCWYERLPGAAGEENEMVDGG